MEFECVDNRTIGHIATNVPKEVKSLSIKGTHMIKDVIHAIYDLVYKNTTLKEVTLDDCDIHNRRFRKLLLMCQDSVITRLDLRNNPIGDDGVEEIHEIPLPKTLTHLTLVNTNITDQGAHILSLVIRDTSTLKMLDLRGNRISRRGLLSLAMYCRHLHELHFDVPNDCEDLCAYITMKCNKNKTFNFYIMPFPPHLITQIEAAKKQPPNIRPGIYHFDIAADPTPCINEMILPSANHLYLVSVDEPGKMAYNERKIPIDYKWSCRLVMRQTNQRSAFSIVIDKADSCIVLYNGITRAMVFPQSCILIVQGVDKQRRELIHSVLQTLYQGQAPLRPPPLDPQRLQEILESSAGPPPTPSEDADSVRSQEKPVFPSLSSSES